MFSKIVSVILGRSYNTDVCSSAYFACDFGFD